MALARQRGTLSFPGDIFSIANVFLGTGSKLVSLPEGLLAWIPQIWKVTDDQILEAAGLDAYVVCVPVKSQS